MFVTLEVRALSLALKSLLLATRWGQTYANSIIIPVCIFNSSLGVLLDHTICYRCECTPGDFQQDEIKSLKLKRKVGVIQESCDNGCFFPLFSAVFPISPWLFSELSGYFYHIFYIHFAAPPWFLFLSALSFVCPVSKIFFPFSRFPFSAFLQMFWFRLWSV